MGKCVESMVILFVDDMNSGRATIALVFKKSLQEKWTKMK